ncbi:hypothetical protein CC1G_03849 [Coprinopsis cinerea okayama7|uniref:Uncharacterized protein n=1 Tax=Coprinopsis cinerea (strain Okayama-7 / 130 / ATCC MYA-4618 / FGSC 9003) TaxID=240176 RepID=A8NGY8_COPC7|nr:hypothetical protein CC1G_03849 [Coprinopsis cinerea okayama7\|eukprot:XP_001833632.1 hypothetical protein CC1G_03849 [Coprinopsis cinerea okayama7\
MTAAISQPRSGILLQQQDWPSSSSAASSTPSSTADSSLISLTPASTPTVPAAFRQPSPPTSRKIRFAPLPDPRRAVLIDENGAEVPIPFGEDATQIPSCPVSPAVAPVDLLAHDTSSLSSFGSSKRNSDTDPSTTPGTTTPASTPSEYDNSRPGSPSLAPIPLPPLLPSKVQPLPNSQWPRSKGLSLLRPFKRSSGSPSSSSNTLTPTPSIDRTANGNSGRKGISTEEILTLGTINLFRASSRESSKSSDSGAGWSLTRWASTGGGNQPIKQWGAPLTRSESSQSTQSYRSKTASLLSGLRPSTAPSRSKPSSMTKRGGTRMLNGRVYGGRRLNPNANLFANAPDTEPEFVEWGYGGMGSVRGAKSAGAASRWERLHGSSQDEDLEDGGGMAWVKKRKEEREKKAREEREAKEKAEKEAAAKEAGAGAVSDSGEPPGDDTSTAPPPIPNAVSESSAPTPRASTPDASISNINPLAKASSISVNTHHSASTAVPASPTLSPTREVASLTNHVPAEDDHVFTTMAVPMPRPHRPRSNTRDGRDGLVQPICSPASDVEEKGFHFDVQVVSQSRDSSTDSDSETSSSDSENDDDDEEEDEDEEEVQQQAAMVIGAGMEKISRHRTAEVDHYHS